jgi:hypothetical protein
MISEKRMRLRTRCFNQRNETVLDGEAIIVPPRPARGSKESGCSGRPGAVKTKKEVGK